MIYHLKRLVAAAAACAFIFSPAWAQSFTAKDVERFLSVADDFQALEGKYPDEDFSLELDDPAGFEEMLDDQGRLAIMSTIISRMPAGSDFGKDLRNISKKAGFSNVTKMGQKADAIIMAFAASQISPEDFAMMEQMTPEMLAMMPPQVKDQMGVVMKLMDAVKAVSDEDKNTVAPYIEQFEMAFEG